MSEENKALVRRYLEAFNRKDLSILDQVCAADLVDKTPLPGQRPGLAGFKERAQGFLSVFPDVQLTAEEMLAEGDRVVWMGKARGTHRGEFMRREPSGKRMTIRTFDLLKVR